MKDYVPVDRLFLWLLTDPSDPVLIGELTLVKTSQGVSLRYAQSWLERGFALSEDLPLLDQEYFPAEKASAAGAVEDARPDRWGERVIRYLYKPPRLSLLELLYFAGDDRFGAADSTIANALSMCASFGLSRNDATREVRRVAKAIAGWKNHFRKCGVTKGDVDSLAEQIDRPFLADQRAE